MKQGHGSAPGKVILTGEHSVVYGYPALAAALDLRCNVKSQFREDKLISIHSKDLNFHLQYTENEVIGVKSMKFPGKRFDNIVLAIVNTQKFLEKENGVDLEITSQIPVSAGLGSSAAVVVATIASIANLYDAKLEKDKISQIAFESEKVTHGKPSGIDNSIATYGGVLKFENGTITHMKLTESIPILIGNTKVPRNTKQLVEKVGNNKKTKSKIIEPILNTMGVLVEEFETAVKNNDITKIGELMDINQGLLDSIGVGHSSLSEFIWKSRDSGAIGAKLTGAGGGGCMIALAPNKEKQRKIKETLEQASYEVIPSNLTSQGVLIGNE